MTIDTDYLTTFLIGLLNTPSPTGDTAQHLPGFILNLERILE